MALLAGALAPDVASAIKIKPEEAASYAGREVTIEGFVERVVCSARACLLSFGTSFSGLLVSIPAAVGKSMPPAKEQYESRTVRVTGVVTMQQEHPRIEITRASDIERLELAVGVSGSRMVTKTDNADSTTQAAAPGEPRVTVQASTESKDASVNDIVHALQRENGELDGAGRGEVRDEAGSGLAARVKQLEERVGESAAPRPGMLPLTDAPVLQHQTDDVASLRDQLAAIDANLSNLAASVAALEERVAVLEGTAQGAAAVPHLPDYVIPGQQPPTLHRVSRGWSADRVLRTLGEPIQVVGTGAGPVTWVYGEGRSVTIDERGRVTAAAGF
jgi:hypothetical protein